MRRSDAESTANAGRAGESATTARRDGIRSRRPYVGALAVAAAAAVWIASRPAPYALGGDAEMLLHPLLTDAYRQLAAGRLPVWTTGRWGGSPLIGDAVVGALYPPYYLAYALVPFPHWRALDVSVVLHAALLTTGLVWFLRRLGASSVAAVACGALLLLNPTYVFVTRNWHEYWAALAYWPWLFGAAVALAKERRATTGLLAAVALAAPVYTGYPEFALYAGIPALAWIVLAPGDGRGRRLATALLVGGGAIALALPQVLPGLGMASGSIRLGPGAAERMALLDRFYVLSPSAWLAAIRPAPSAPAMPMKLAPSVVVLAVLGACAPGAAVRWLVVSAVVCGFLATGPNPVYHALHAIPPFSFFGAPLKLFYLADFLVLVLAALGLSRLPALAPAVRRAVIVVLGLVFAASFGHWSAAICLIGIGTALLAAAPARALPAIAATTAVAGSAVFLVATHALDMPPAFLPGVFTDLVRRPVAPAAATEARALALGQSRTTVRQVGLNFGALWGIESWNGMGDLVQWRQYEVLEGARAGAAARLARSLAADPVIVDATGPLAAELTTAGFRQTGTAGGLARFASAGPPRPRAELVPRAKAVPQDVAMAIARTGRALDERHVLVEAETLPGGAHGDPNGVVEVIARAPAAMRLRIVVARPTWLVFREPYYANWQATIDGRSRPIVPAGGFLMALLVDGGRHEVALAYREPGLLPGAAIAGAALVLLPLAFARIAR